jgi:hypothetical protein
VYQPATTIESFDVPVTLGLRNGIVVLPAEALPQIMAFVPHAIPALVMVRQLNTGIEALSQRVTARVPRG